MSNSRRSRAVLGIAFLTVVVGTTALIGAQSRSGRNLARGGGQQPATTTTTTWARPLQLVDANGAFIAPVFDLSSEPGKELVRIVLDVEGRVAVVEAASNGFTHLGPQAVYYESIDCTGTAHIQGAQGLALLPVTAITGVPSLQTLHVADQEAAPISITIRSFRANHISGCQTEANPYIGDRMRPVVAALDLPGEPPFRVVFEPQPPCGAGCAGLPPQ